jgi:hypothetical protein
MANNTAPPSSQMSLPVSLEILRLIETLLANLQRHTLKSRDEQEVAG